MANSDGSFAVVRCVGVNQIRPVIVYDVGAGFTFSIDCFLSCCMCRRVPKGTPIITMWRGEQFVPQRDCFVSIKIQQNC